MLDDLLVVTRFGAGGQAPKDRVRHPVTDEAVWQNKFLQGLQEHAEKHLADQGDGNHFAYLGKLDLGKSFLTALEQAGHEEIVRPLLEASRTRKEAYVLVTHHGSRGLGAQVYQRGHQAAIEETERIASGIPKAAAWLDTRTGLGQEYWKALQYVSRWTKANHHTIHQRFLERWRGTDHGVRERTQLRLATGGCVSAWQRGHSGMEGRRGRPLLGLIPLNMAEPILITLGSDNADHLSFCPHGAGRNRSRSATRRDFPRRRRQAGRSSHGKKFVKRPGDWISVDAHGKADVTESPIGYKPAAQVRAQIAQFGLGKIIGEITPLGCIMAGDPGPRPWLRERELTPKQKRAIEHRAERRQMRRSLTHWDDADDEEFGAPP
ncbi:MAG: RtcB family protein [Verrucomicrobiales bacterium]